MLKQLSGTALSKCRNRDKFKQLKLAQCQQSTSLHQYKKIKNELFLTCQKGKIKILTFGMPGNVDG